MADQNNRSKALEITKALLLPLIIALVGGSFSFFQHQSQIEKQYLDRIATLLEDLASDDSTKKALAITYMRALADDEKIKPEFAEKLAEISLHKALGRLEDKEVVDSTVALAIGENFEEVSTRVVRALRARVFLHIPDDSLRAKAEEIKELLEEQGYLVPEIRGVDVRVRDNQLRFLKTADESLATKIRDSLRDRGFIFRIVDLSGSYEDSPNVRPKTLELWVIR